MERKKLYEVGKSEERQDFLRGKEAKFLVF